MPKNLYIITPYYYMTKNKLWRNTYEFRRRRKTMLLTLFAKAKHSQQKNHKFYDSKAIEVMSKVDYDFSIAEKDKFMQLGTIARTIVLDDMVGEYIKAHPDCTIVNIAS